MRIWLHIGPDAAASDRMQHVLAGKRAQLLRKGVLFPRSPGARNHTRLFMAVSDARNVDSLRHHRGYADPERQKALRAEVVAQLGSEIKQAAPDVLILSCHQLGHALVSVSELRRLAELLKSFSKDIKVLAHIDDPARLLMRHYVGQVFDGRVNGLDQELGLLDGPDFRAAALAARPEPAPENAVFAEAQGANFWIDFKGLERAWEDVFGVGAMRFRSLDLPQLYGTDATDALRADFEIGARFGKANAEPLPALPSAAWLARARLLNQALMAQIKTDGLILPRQTWRRFLNEQRIDGPAPQAGQLARISDYFRQNINDLCDAHPGLDPKAMRPDAPLPDWQDARPEQGFRAGQVLLSLQPRLKRADKDARRAATPGPLPDGPDSLPAEARRKAQHLRRSGFAPHNRMGRVNEEELAPAFPQAPPRHLAKGDTGRVIVGCMKNEAPYILEWVAYHRTIGVDHFLIYTNDCDDGTDAILDRLQALGVVQHRDNANWSGNSPQQFALDQALGEPVVQQAEWLIHIDVDEFINIRCGDGTLDAFFERCPDATNVAMTWRLFGHNGVQKLDDRPVIAQFDSCAPKYCPKPHTAWGFKTMFRNMGAYGKMSCHRPNKLIKNMAAQVKWVNGSGADMTGEALNSGWRNSRKSIGYDLLQLNHYALRSMDSFLIKRQRGRALHVDRSIGLNYWVRMDWGDHRDITIKRNLPRLRAEMARLLRDDTLRSLHAAGLAWHRKRAEILRDQPEFRDLCAQAMALELDEVDRAAYVLALEFDG